jgi:hypothetical protein
LKLQKTTVDEEPARDFQIVRGYKTYIVSEVQYRQAE